MTIDFNTIKVHDLVCLEGESGWYIVTDVRVGHHIEVRVLGEIYPLIFLDKDDLGTIHKVIRSADAIASMPDMLAALLAVERAEQLSNVCGDDPDAIEEWIEASNDAMEKVNAVLKRLRDAGVIEKAEGR